MNTFLFLSVCAVTIAVHLAVWRWMYLTLGKKTQVEAKPEPAVPVFPIEFAVMWGAFLTEGLLSKHKAHALSSRMDIGFIDLISDLPPYAAIIWETIHQLQKRPFDVPAVFEYEVVAPLGEHLAYHINKHGEWPSYDKFREEVVSLYQKYQKRNAPQQPDPQ